MITRSQVTRGLAGRADDMPLQSPLSWAQVAALALAAGFSPGDAVVATSITQPESARIQNIIQQGQPYSATGWGLWQITPGDSEPQFGIDDAMLIGINNAHAAKAKFDGAGGFTPWTTWAHGFNVPFLGDASAAVAAVSGLSLHDLNKLVASTGAAGSINYPSPGHILSGIEAQLRAYFTGLEKQLIYQRMELARMGRPGWQPR
jgi:hypothetical protein